MVVIGTAPQRVRTKAAADFIIAIASFNDIIFGIAPKDIIAQPSFKPIFAAMPAYDVITGISDQSICAIVAVNIVGALRSEHILYAG